MEPEGLNGSKFTINVTYKTHGASQRLVVSPGYEKDGLFHMPGGNSGHFMSSHYDDMHQAWVNGIPLKLLNGTEA